MRNRSSREAIITTACEMFYSKGYNATSMEDIARRCAIRKQAITYHFGTKAELGRVVTHQYSIRLKTSFTETVTAQAGPVDELVMSAAYLLWFSGYFRQDQKAFRFFEEFVFADPNFEDIVKNEEEEFYTTFGIEHDRPGRGTETKLRSVSTFYAGKGLLHQYGSGLIACGPEEFARYFFLNYFSPFVNDEAAVEKIYRSAREILSGVTIRVLENYRVG